ncbi:MAG: TetR/AcrR family transcriptional regulator [Elusimicrobia bacterium]|nr:TetR/AcrR family transcriptional regulator [Elusimicrobiota bacterium]
MVRATPTHSPAKARLLDAAERLMLAKGFEATSVEEICKKASLTKGSFFHYFETKEELGKAVLEHFCEAKMREFQASPFLKKTDPLERVYGQIDFAIAMSKKKKDDPIARNSCLVGTFTQELSTTHPEIRSLCAQKFAQWTGGFKQQLDAAKAKYAPHVRLDTRSLAEHFLAVLEGSILLAKAKQNPSVIEQNLQHFKQYLRSLFGR